MPDAALDRAAGPSVARAAALSAFAAFVLYLPTLSFGFLWDDTAFILRNPFLKDPSHLWQVFVHFFAREVAPVAGGARPLWIATLVWDRWIWDLNPVGYHLTNVLLHALVSGLAAVLAARLLGADRPGSNGRVSPSADRPGSNGRASNTAGWPALAVGLAFAVHPVHVEPVAAVTFRPDLLAAAFTLASCLAYLAFSDGTRPRGARAAAYAGALAAYGAALLAKESAAPLPAVLWALDWVRGRSAHGEARPLDPGRPAHGEARPLDPGRPAHGEARPFDSGRPAHGEARPFDSGRPASPWARPFRRVLVYLPFFLLLAGYAHLHRLRFDYDLRKSTVSQQDAGSLSGRLLFGEPPASGEARPLDEGRPASGEARPLDEGRPASGQARPFGEEPPAVAAASPGAARPGAEGAVYTDPAACVATMAPVFGRYVLHLLWPAGQSPDYDVPVRRSPFAPAPALGLLALAAAVAVVVAARRRAPAAAWGMAWFLLFLTPVANVVPVVNLMADRYLYLPSFGLFLAVAAAVVEFRRRRPAVPGRAVAAAAGLLLAAWAVLATGYARVWRDDLTLFTEAARTAPGNFRPWYNLGLAHQRRGDWRRAADAYRRAAEQGPGRPEVYVNLGRAQEALGDPAAAEAAYLEALKADPKDALAHYNLGSLRFARGDHRAAADAYRAALDASDRFLAAAQGLAAALRASGDLAGAERYSALAREWRPAEASIEDR
jgi:Tfp pilus assembly protein PilF